jgi:hypothetical protein
MDVPVVWIDGMIEAGELQYHEGPDGKILVDAEDIQVLKGAGDPPTVPSLSHVRAMLRRVMGCISSETSGTHLNQEACHASATHRLPHPGVLPGSGFGVSLGHDAQRCPTTF